MLPILTPDDAAVLDQASAERGVTVQALMENAGWAVARAALAMTGRGYGSRAVVVCGKGNNGGDGLVAGRYLERWGFGVTVLLLAERSAIRGVAASNLRRFEEAGGRCLPFSSGVVEREMARADVEDGSISELSVYCTGDWDTERVAEHQAAVSLLRP